MQDIDFLPAEYFQRRVRQQARPWRIAALTLFAALATVAAAGQYLQRQRLQAELDALLPAYQLAAGEQQRLAQMQAKLQTEEQTAGLLAYLRHPWPKTQILRALVDNLPEQVVFDQLRIGRQQRQTQRPAEARPASAEQQEDLSKLPPAQRDLRVLQEEYDTSEVYVRIEGYTSDSSALYGWLAALGKQRLLAKAELTSLETAAQTGPNLMRFGAVVVVVPGYGHPGSPTAAEAGQLAGPASVPSAGGR
jgi:Tfp pilus assembly protein PilN